jgi:predicted ATPase
MLQQIEATNFRCFSHIQQPLNPFQVLIGPNATGKSTFLDVIAFLSECLNEGPLQAIEKRTSNFANLLHKGGGQFFELAVVLSVPERLRKENPEYDRCRYQITIGQETKTETISILSESFWLIKSDSPLTRQKSNHQLLLPVSEEESASSQRRRVPAGWRTVVNKTEGGNYYFKSETTGWNFTLRLGPTKSALANLPEEEERFPIATWAKHQLMDGVRFLQLNSRQMRLPCAAFSPTDFALDGSNLPKVIQSVQRENENRFSNWLAHVRQALPDIEGILIRERPEERSLYLVLRYQQGYEVPSWMLSDGTLRLLALTLIAYVQKEEGIYLIEEPENGVHPTALEVIFQSLTSVYDSQVLLATHSPVLLSLAKPEQILCFRLEEGAASIRTGSETPALQDWRGVPDMGVLFAAGVL